MLKAQATLLILTVTLSVSSFAGEPGLSDDELAHLRNMVGLSQQDLNDWTGWEEGGTLGAYRYQISFMTYALASQQFHSVPAYRDLYKETMERLMERMIQKPAWEFWEKTSKGGKAWDPDWDGTEKGWRDPVRKQNIMYSGHIVHMATLYESLYRDTRWSQPGAITFEWNSDERYVYDLPSLMKIIYTETLQTDKHSGQPMGGVACEPNVIFPECNQHPTLAFMLYDVVHDTKMSGAIRSAFTNWFARTEMYDENHHAGVFHRVKQNNVLRFPEGSKTSADGWTGVFMHAWDPERIEEMYESQREAHFRVGADGKISMMQTNTPELGLGFFAALAIEVGDEKTAERLFQYAEEHLRPIRENGALRYEPNLEAEVDYSNNTSDKVIALARSNRKNGMWQLHNRPWQDSEFEYPLLESVDFPNVLVRRAEWDASENTLMLTMLPGNEDTKATTFHLGNLKAAQHYTMRVAGEAFANFTLGEKFPDARLKQIEGDTISVSLPLAVETVVTLKEFSD